MVSQGPCWKQHPPSFTGEGSRAQKALTPHPQGMELWASRQERGHWGVCSGGSWVVTAAEMAGKGTSAIVRRATEAQTQG